MHFFILERNVNYLVFGKAAAIYFNDPDGNELEFISSLPSEPKNLGYAVYLSEWNDMVKSEKSQN